MTTAHDNLVRNLKTMAKQRGWSLNRLADASGLSRGAMSHILRQQKSPTLNTLEKLATALEVAVFVLLGDELPRAKPRTTTLAERSISSGPAVGEVDAG
jgi:transcriptional regulator with XRE-family HTH domain